MARSASFFFGANDEPDLIDLLFYGDFQLRSVVVPIRVCDDVSMVMFDLDVLIRRERNRCKLLDSHLVKASHRAIIGAISGEGKRAIALDLATRVDTVFLIEELDGTKHDGRSIFKFDCSLNFVGAGVVAATY